MVEDLWAGLLRLEEVVGFAVVVDVVYLSHPSYRSSSAWIRLQAKGRWRNVRRSSTSYDPPT